MSALMLPLGKENCASLPSELSQPVGPDGVGGEGVGAGLGALVAQTKQSESGFLTQTWHWLSSGTQTGQLISLLSHKKMAGYGNLHLAMLDAHLDHLFFRPCFFRPDRSSEKNRRHDHTGAVLHVRQGHRPALGGIRASSRRRRGPSNCADASGLRSLLLPAHVPDERRPDQYCQGQRHLHLIRYNTDQTNLASINLYSLVMPTQTRNPKKNKKRHHPPPKPPKPPAAARAAAAAPDLRSIQSMLGPDVMQQLQRTLQQAATSVAGVSRRQQAAAIASAAAAGAAGAAGAAAPRAPATAAAPAEEGESRTSSPTVLRKFCPPSHLPNLL